MNGERDGSKASSVGEQMVVVTGTLMEAKRNQG